MFSGSGGPRERLDGFVREAGKWAQSPWVAYPAIVLFQLKVLWGAWIYRDLTQGDTASYFQRSLLWHQYGKVDLIWSPLYTAFYGWCFGITGDVYAATIFHRVVIVILVALLVLALFRRLVSPGIAWLAAAWWAVIPYNFDVFEVHIFAILPLVAAPLAVLVWPGPVGRGVALAIMAAAAVLVRNEMAVVAVLLAILFLAWEVRYAARLGERKPDSSRAYGTAYGVPLAVSGAVVLFFVARSAIPLPLLSGAYEPKHTINMCQAYAFGYKQRHPEWTKDHWTECSDLMQSRFGERYPSLWTMVRRNPRAVLGHFAWNLRLLPNGTQLSLFGAMSGSVTPDYNPVRIRRPSALLESGLLLALVVAGVVARSRKRGSARQTLSHEHAIGWLALAPAAAVAVLIIVPTQRPRPEYLYGLSLPIIAAAAWSVDVLRRRWPPMDRFTFWIPAAMGGLLLAVPYYYVLPAHADATRPLLETIRRLEPSQAVISNPRTVFAAGPFAFNIRRYLVRASAESYLQAQLRPQSDWLTEQGLAPKVLGPSQLGPLPDHSTVESFLDERGINMLYLDEEMCRGVLANAAHRPFLEGIGRNGWRLLAGGRSGNGDWMLVARATPAGV